MSPWIRARAARYEHRTHAISVERWSVPRGWYVQGIPTIEGTRFHAMRTAKRAAEARLAAAACRECGARDLSHEEGCKNGGRS